MRPRVSVIIPTYNRGSIVTRAADSVLSQDFEDFEVIVVDDGSTDDTAETLSTYEARIRRKGDGFVKLRILRQENQGVCAARNAGIFASKGEWIAFLDSDDEWLPGKLSLQMREVGGVGGGLPSYNERFPDGEWPREKSL